MEKNGKRKLSAAEIDEKLDALENARLMKWYERWGTRPWIYTLASVAKQIPWLLIFALVFKWQNMKTFFSDPVSFLSQRGGFILFGIFIFLFYFRMNWEKNAFRYYLLHRLDPAEWPLDEDSKLAGKGRRSAQGLENKFRTWGSDRAWLPLLMGILIPAAFLLFLYMAIGIGEGNWKMGAVVEAFESKSLFFIVIGIFMLLGVWIGYGIRNEIKDNYQLLSKATTHP